MKKIILSSLCFFILSANGQQIENYLDFRKAVLCHIKQEADSRLENVLIGESDKGTLPTYISRLCPCGHTLLFNAVDANYLKGVELLHRYGFSINDRDENNETPAIRAARCGNVDSLKALVSIDGSVIKDHSGRHDVRGAAKKYEKQKVLDYLDNLILQAEK